MSADEEHHLVAARLAAIVDSSFDAIISKDLNSVITSWNPAAEHFFGYRAEEVIGKSIRILIPESHQSEEDDIISRVRAGEVVQSFETLRVRKDGSFIPVSLTVSPIKDENGRIVGASKIARDITVSRDNERRIRLLLREVNHRVKNQYAVMMSIIRETAKRTQSVEEFQQQINERITSLASSHDVLVSTDWKGGDLTTLINDQLKPFKHDGLITVTGPQLILAASAVLHIGMAMHELATNSAKYGVLASSLGNITISWTIDSSGDEEVLKLRWDETNNAPGVKMEHKSGFGYVVLQRATPLALRGSAQITVNDERRMWELVAPLKECVSDVADNEL